MPLFLWLLVGIPGGVCAWFFLGALAERLCRRVFDPIVALTGHPASDTETLFWAGPFGLITYLFASTFYVPVKGVIVVWNFFPSFGKFFKWLRGIDSAPEDEN